MAACIDHVLPSRAGQDALRARGVYVRSCYVMTEFVDVTSYGASHEERVCLGRAATIEADVDSNVSQSQVQAAFRDVLGVEIVVDSIMCIAPPARVSYVIRVASLPDDFGLSFGEAPTERAAPVVYVPFRAMED